MLQAATLRRYNYQQQCNAQRCGAARVAAALHGLLRRCGATQVATTLQ
jgi:hypothetical protein